MKTVIRAIVPRAMRNWLRSPSKSMKWLWNCAQFSLGFTCVARLLPDWDLRCHPHAYEVLVRDQIHDPDQSAEFRNFVSHCSDSMLLFDVGAHFGVFSLVTAHFGGRAVAVDPSPTATRMIAVQAALNGLTDKIQIVRAALSDANGTLALLGSGAFSDGYFQVTKGRSRSELTEMPAVTLDRMAEQFGAPTHVKIDVEGHEVAVIRGARQLLTEHSPVLFLEIHNKLILSAGGNPAALLDDLDRLGYATFSVSGEAVGRQAILSKPIVRIVGKRHA
jgi:FkbM family methyltransferase